MKKTMQAKDQSIARDLDDLISHYEHLFEVYAWMQEFSKASLCEDFLGYLRALKDKVSP